MELRRLGKSGTLVSPICLGAMMFSDRTDEGEAGRIVASAKEAGVNFIDTADVYVQGKSEEMTGRLLKAERNHWIIATKFGNQMGKDANQKGSGRRWIMRACEDSLRRLGVETIDLYYIHRDDLDTPLEETIAALGDLISAGKIRYIGLSNFRAYRIAAFTMLCRQMGVPQPVALQPYYNAMDRTGETEVLPAAAYCGLGVVSYSPLSRGVLTGKYAPDGKPEQGTRAGRADRRMMETEFRQESLVLAQQIKKHAETRGITAGQFALNWVLNNKLITSVLAGPRTMEQWQEYVKALDYKFTREDEALIDGMVKTGHASTHFYTDPAYPITGRQPRNA
jgi:aryl-alcohol dehydrogenase-like predicted oxidoreductase